MTIREQILTTLVARADTVPNVQAFRSREAALARSEGISVFVHPEEESADLKGMGVVMRDLLVVLSVIARGQIADKVADPIVQGIHAVITADQTLGGLVARTVEDSTKWNFEIADQNAVAVEMRYRFRYLTPATSLSSPA